jgi:hypothetical protein
MRAKPTVSLSVRLPPNVREAAERAATDSQKSLRDFVSRPVVTLQAQVFLGALGMGRGGQVGCVRNNSDSQLPCHLHGRAGTPGSLVYMTSPGSYFIFLGIRSPQGGEPGQLVYPLPAWPGTCLERGKCCRTSMLLTGSCWLAAWSISACWCCGEFKAIGPSAPSLGPLQPVHPHR